MTRFWILFGGDVRPSVTEAGNAAQAAKVFCERGARGIVTIADEYGNTSRWELRATMIHYAYPVFS